MKTCAKYYMTFCTLLIAILCLFNVIILFKRKIQNIYPHQETQHYYDFAQNHFAVKESVRSSEDSFSIEWNNGGECEFDNSFRSGNISTHWYNDTILKDVSYLKLSSLIYRVNVGEVKKRAAKWGPRNYVPNVTNPCWVEILNAENPYRTNPLPAIRNKGFQRMEDTLRFRLQRHPTNATRTRCLPYFYVIGTSKSGTTDFFENLVKHQNIVAPGAKEPTWWNARLGGSANVRFRDYIDLFDIAADDIWQSWKINHTTKLTGEGTPSYCYDNDGWPIIPGNGGLSEPRYGLPHVIRYITPEARIILLLRNPVERLYSHFRNVRPHDSPDIFHEYVMKAIRLMESCLRSRTVRSCFYDPHLNKQILPLHLRASMYPVMLHDWLCVFPRGHVIVLKAENYFQNRLKTLNRVYNFLGLEPLDEKIARRLQSSHVVNDKGDRGASLENMRADTRIILSNFVSIFNDRVKTILGPDFRW